MRQPPTYALKPTSRKLLSLIALSAFSLIGSKVWMLAQQTQGSSDQNSASANKRTADDLSAVMPETGNFNGVVTPSTPSKSSLPTLESTGQVKIDISGTGETIGHIADLRIRNLTKQPLTCAVPPVILESGSGKNQHYACPSGQTVALNPHQTKTVPMNGVCLNRNKPPVGKGVSGDLVMNEANPAAPQNPNSHIAVAQARDLLRICTSKYDAADKLQKAGALKALPYKEKQKQRDIVVQWSTWCDPRISQITGAPAATKGDLRKVVYKQVEAKGPMSPETKKKVDQGIDTIFEKVELTTAKAKDLEKPEPAGGETPLAGGTTVKTGENPPVTQEKPKASPAPPSYPFTKETDCGTITISIGDKGEIVFDFKPKKSDKCPCKEFGWIQHIAPADTDAWRYDNGVLPGVSTPRRQGARSDPSKPKQPTTPPKGTNLEDWDKNPWYGGTTDKSKPKDFGEHPTPQTHISDKPDAPNTKYITQLVCVETGEVLFSWEWGPIEKGNEALDKVPGKSIPPP